MNTLRFAAAAASLLLAPAAIHSQDSPPMIMGGPVADQTPVTNGGTVTGHVVCDDTQRPARFARVQLTPIQPPSSDDNGRRVFRGAFGGSARTDFDGNFRVLNVAPGDYYVQVIAPGYLSLRQQVQEQIAAGANPNDVAARLPAVHVETNGGAAATVTLEHGATISGTLLWPDGSPVTGVTMLMQSATQTNNQQLPPPLNNMPVFGGNTFSSTDDRGRFRLTGVAPGDWLVMANVDGAAASQAGDNPGTLRLYAPGVFRRADAKPLTIHRGEERDDIRMTLDISKLHTVSGHASAPGLSGNFSGFVQLSDASDNSFHAGAQLQRDGSFAVPFVPPGNYSLNINGRIGDPPRRGDNGTQQSLVPYTGSVVVTDTDLGGLNVTLTQRTQTSSNAPAAR